MSNKPKLDLDIKDRKKNKNFDEMTSNKEFISS